MNQNLFPCVLWTVGLLSSATVVAGGPALQPATMQPPAALMNSVTSNQAVDSAADFPAPGYTVGDMQSPCLSPAPTKFATIKTEIISAIQGVIDNQQATTDDIANSEEPQQNESPEYEVPQFEASRTDDAGDAGDNQVEPATEDEALADAQIWNDAQRGESPDREDAPLGDVTQSEFGIETGETEVESTSEPSTNQESTIEESMTEEPGTEQSIGDQVNLDETDAPSARFSGGIITLPEYPVDGPDSDDQVDGTNFRALENVIQQTFDGLLYPLAK